MRGFCRKVVLNSLSLALLVEFFPGFSLTGGFSGLLIAGAELTLINLIVRPILKLLFLPINILTLGSLAWIVNVISFSLLLLFSQQAKVSAFYFNGFTFGALKLTGFSVTAFFSLIFAAIFLNLLESILRWLTET